jgi:O-antigen ligase
MQWRDRLGRIVEAGIYIYLIFLLLSRGEGIRNVILFGNFILWLVIYEKKVSLIRHHVYIALLAFIGSAVISSIFSLDHAYSLFELTKEPLRAFLLFPVFMAFLDDQRRLLRVCYALTFALVVILLNGYYSYLIKGLEIFHSRTWLLSEWYNKYASYLNILWPFMIPLFLYTDRRILRSTVIAIYLLTITALILNGTRTAWLSFITIHLIWLYFGREAIKRLNINLFILVLTIIVITVILTIYSPYVEEKIMTSIPQLNTLNYRTTGWRAAVEAFRARPLLGWGYGEMIFHRDEPFKETSFKRRPYVEVKDEDSEWRLYLDDPHNTFLMVLFHQGIIGLTAYVVLIGLAVSVLWGAIVRQGEGWKRHFMIACLSSLIGNFIVYAFFNPIRFHYLAVIIALGMAAMRGDEDSHN